MYEYPYWADNWFATRAVKAKFDRLKSQVAQANTDSASDLRAVMSAIDQTETDIGRVLLKLHAVTELLIEKGLVTGEELTAKARELDTLDGESDGALHPNMFRTEAEQQRVPSPRSYLIKMEKEVRSPKEFLAGLEESDEGG